MFMIMVHNVNQKLNEIKLKKFKYTKSINYIQLS